MLFLAIGAIFTNIKFLSSTAYTHTLIFTHTHTDTQWEKSTCTQNSETHQCTLTDVHAFRQVVILAQAVTSSHFKRHKPMRKWEKRNGFAFLRDATLLPNLGTWAYLFYLFQPLNQSTYQLLWFLNIESGPMAHPPIRAPLRGWMCQVWTYLCRINGTANLQVLKLKIPFPISSAICCIGKLYKMINQLELCGKELVDCTKAIFAQKYAYCCVFVFKHCIFLLL